MPKPPHAIADAGPAAPAHIAAESAIAAAHLIAGFLERGQRVDATVLRDAMQSAFGRTDADGGWDWKSAYDVCEAAQVLFLRKYAKALTRKYGEPAKMLAMIEKVAGLLPTHTRRSETSQALQQFSTPVGLAYIAALAAKIRPGDLVLEPSAGTGLLAIHAEIANAGLTINELGNSRADLLGRLFPDATVTRHDAAQIDDRLDPALIPTVVLMNPPFSAVANVDRAVRDAALRHIASALARLAPGGRLVAITGAGCSPYVPAWEGAFAKLQEQATILFSAAIDGQVYAKHGTGIDTRLTVFERKPAASSTTFPPPPGMAPDTATLLQWILDLVPPRDPTPPPVQQVLTTAFGFAPVRVAAKARSKLEPVASPDDTRIVELAYEAIDWMPPPAALTDSIYEPYAPQSMRIEGARQHPTPLVQSAAMASVAPPRPTYRPKLPARLVEEGILSDVQLEAVVYAGQAHAGLLPGSWRVDETYDVVSVAPDEAEDAVRFRRGWFCGDGTGAGKGREVAGIILDNWQQGRRRAVWVSLSDKLLADAQRDWSALGQERLQVTPLARFAQGAPIRLDEGVLFTTYATLRSEERGDKVSRVQQIVDLLGHDFDGVIVFDEAHAMANAAGGKGERGDQPPSQQGRAGLRLQHALPNARIVYVSATGATTVRNLAYAERLGLWLGEDFPFESRGEFVAAIEDGGVAAMEVVARDLKALGLYTARALSFDGVEYEVLEHALTPEQVRIYDAYAGAFEIIHNNLGAAMHAANITSDSGALNARANSAARAVFEAAKQRFFNHLIVAMQTPSMIASIEADLAVGHSAVIQLISTGEALQERRLAEIPTDEWDDVRVDITPREYVLDYLEHGFPVQLYEPYSDASGNVYSRAVYQDGNPVECREAIRRRQQLIEHLASLPAVPGALDQIIHHFGTEQVAEVTGRSRRIVARRREGAVRFAVENRPGSAGLVEEQAFMDDRKRVLVFSEAGGTGRSYHADLAAKNQRPRIHYLLEAGWRADVAIQGLGRTNRTNQAQPPLYRLVTTDVKAQKRFISTIARRLDTLGAMTRGQRQTGGQNMFRPEDNLESDYARDALRQLYVLLVGGRIEGCSLSRFEQATGLRLAAKDTGGLLDELPPITTFLNRMLALTIDLQTVVFAAFEGLLTRRIEGAIAAGVYEIGLETLVAESFVVTERRTIYTHPGTGATTALLTIACKDRNRPHMLERALAWAEAPGATLLVNSRSGRAAVQVRERSVMLDDGRIERRVRLIRPMDSMTMSLDALAETHWAVADVPTFSAVWDAEVATVAEFETSTMHIVAGLLLPIWKRLPDRATRVYRLQTDDGERVVGRRVSPAWVAATFDETPTLNAAEGWALLVSGDATLHLAEGQTLSRVRAMGAHRIELTGFNDLGVERLKAFGLISEIVSWKLRLYVPTGDDGATVLARLMERFPLQRIGGRHAATAA